MDNSGSVSNVSFLNPDGTLVTVIVNQNGSDQVFTRVSDASRSAPHRPSRPSAPTCGPAPTARTPRRRRLRRTSPPSPQPCCHGTPLRTTSA
ncbi:hypothetical protein C8250_034495 [Streptomyces sp. So13.3]|nr:hypothetical protein C8250_034495 [Streptomyces sp. So13.3]